MIEYWGYPTEEHSVTTDDGYILALHRIPNPGGYPVFLGHCLFGTSAVYSFGPPDKSIAYMLHDAGYDVWMGNTRGNTWSKKHVSLDPCGNCSQFWDFQWEITAKMDYPVEIDFVLDYTGFKDLFLVGYSMGTSQYFAMLSDMPEYNDKIKAGFMMAPSTFRAGYEDTRAYENWKDFEDNFHRRSKC